MYFLASSRTSGGRIPQPQPHDSASNRRDVLGKRRTQSIAESIAEIVGESSSKRLRVDGPGRRIVEDGRTTFALSAGASHNSRVEIPSIKAEQPVVANPQPGSPSAIWKVLFQDTDKFRIIEYYQRITGAYVISCPLIEDDIQGWKASLL